MVEAMAVDGEAAKVAGKARVWPPSDPNRALLVERMTSNLMSLSFFSPSRVLPDEESARAAVTTIEETAFKEASALEGESNKQKMTHYIKASSNGLLVAATKASKVAPAAAAVGGAMEVAAAAPALAESLSHLDISEGSREFLSADRAAELLVVPDGGALASVKLSGKSFGLDAADVAARILSKASGTLKHADLSDIIAGRPEDEALKVLTKMTDALAGAQLATLDLSDNAFGEKGIRACGKLLKSQKKLEAISFCNNGISVQAAAAIAELLTEVDSLQKIHLFNNMSGDDGAAQIASVIKRAGKLRDFKMACSRVSTAGAEALSNALAGSKELQSIDLHDNNIGEEGGVHMAAMLQDLPNLRSLNLSELSLGDSGITAIAAALAGTAPQLEVLEVSCNEITAAGARALANCLANKSALKRLVIAENEIGDKGAVLLAKALKILPAMEELDASQNEIRKVGAVALATAMSKKASLKSVALNSNYISEDGVSDIQELIPEEKLGTLEDNDPEGGDEDEEEDEEEEGGEEDAELESALDKLKI